MRQKQIKTIRQFIQEFLEAHPNEDIAHGTVVDWVTEKWIAQQKRLGNSNPTPPRDPWRTVRRLHQEGWLIKVRKGVYCYDPKTAQSVKLDDFTPEQRQQIFERDGYRCVICGRGQKDGLELHVDHIKPRHLGGKSEIENGQTLCSECNLRKKIYKQTETGKRMFIRLYEVAKKEKDEKIISFCKEILELYKKHGINDHIKWDQ